VVHSRYHLTGAATALALALSPVVASAQQANPGYFIPTQPQQRPAAPARPPARPVQTPPPAPLGGEASGPDGAQTPPQQLQVQLPPAPEVPTLPKGASPPAAIIGILSVPDVLRISAAYQQADKELGQRRQKLNEDAQKEQVSLRDVGQAFANERGKMSPEQIRAREREYQERVNESRRKFSDRNRIIQEAGQYVMAQIDRTLEQVAQHVAVSRGINLVLNRAQLLGTTADFDMTPQVAEVLNQVLPSVLIPPDGVSPVAMAVPGAPAQTATPAAASGTQALGGGAKPAAPATPLPPAASPQPGAAQRKP
jgi:Skp family chaperone for outer membrane proteins